MSQKLGVLCNTLSEYLGHGKGCGSNVKFEQFADLLYKFKSIPLKLSMKPVEYSLKTQKEIVGKYGTSDHLTY